MDGGSVAVQFRQDSHHRMEGAESKNCISRLRPKAGCPPGFSDGGMTGRRATQGRKAGLERLPGQAPGNIQAGHVPVGNAGAKGDHHTFQILVGKEREHGEHPPRGRQVGQVGRQGLGRVGIVGHVQDA